MVTVLTVVLAACTPAPEPEGNDDWERGVQRGYEIAFETAYRCIQDLLEEELDSANVGECLY